MPGRDPDHWLYRLSPEEWLQAARNELKHASESLAHKQQRSGVAGARRAAGMAWNAVLACAESLDESYGRSYMDHLHALAKDAGSPDEIRSAAHALTTAPLQLDIVPLVAHSDVPKLARDAEQIVAYAQRIISKEPSA